MKGRVAIFVSRVDVSAIAGLVTCKLEDDALVALFGSNMQQTLLVLILFVVDSTSELDL